MHILEMLMSDASAICLRLETSLLHSIGKGQFCLNKVDFGLNARGQLLRYSSRVIGSEVKKSTVYWIDNGPIAKNMVESEYVRIYSI